MGQEEVEGGRAKRDVRRTLRSVVDVLLLSLS